METPRPPSRAEDQHQVDTDREGNSHSSLPDQRVRLLLGHQSVQRSDGLQDSTGVLPYGSIVSGTKYLGGGGHGVPEKALL